MQRLSAIACRLGLVAAPRAEHAPQKARDNLCLTAQGNYGAWLDGFDALWDDGCTTSDGRQQ